MRAAFLQTYRLPIVKFDAYSQLEFEQSAYGNLHLHLEEGNENVLERRYCCKAKLFIQSQFAITEYRPMAGPAIPR